MLVYMLILSMYSGEGESSDGPVARLPGVAPRSEVAGRARPGAPAARPDLGAVPRARPAAPALAVRRPAEPTRAGGLHRPRADVRLQAGPGAGAPWSPRAAQQRGRPARPAAHPHPARRRGGDRRPGDRGRAGGTPA